MHHYTARMDIEELRQRFLPAIEKILDQCRITEDLVDTEMFQIYMATVWGNAVIDPEQSGITEAELDKLHDYLGEELSRVVGRPTDLTSTYEFIVSKAGDDSLARLQIGQQHREFLYYFARLILQREIKV